MEDLRREALAAKQYPVISKNESKEFIWEEAENASHRLGWIATDTPGWKSFGIIFEHKPCKENSARCPKTLAFLKRLVDKRGWKIRMAGFSLLEPGTIIKPHTDTNNGAECTAHLGVDVPAGCYLYHDGLQEAEENGKFILFDPRRRHWACNRSSRDRIILLMIVDTSYRSPSSARQ